MTEKVADSGSSDVLGLRLLRLERIVTTLLAGALRGSLRAPERKILQRALSELKALHRQQRQASGRGRCPACLSKLAKPRARRCPFCGVLLGEARKAARQLQAAE